MISQADIDQYHELGYCVLPNFKSLDDIATLKTRALEIVQAHDLSEQKTIFTTDRSEADILMRSNNYFLDSDNSVRCFFEEEAFDANGDLNQDLALSINKIGHAMHDLDPVFRKFTSGEDLHQVATGLGQQSPELRQSMYIFKQPRIGGKVGWHQDATFFYTEPISVITFWFALEDATLENGCLWVEPGGHRSDLRERFEREGRQIKMRQISDQVWPENETAIPLEVKTGTLICFHGVLPHYSAENRSENARHALTLHVTDGASVYAAENWIQRSADFPVRGFI